MRWNQSNTRYPKTFNDGCDISCAITTGNTKLICRSNYLHACKHVWYIIYEFWKHLSTSPVPLRPFTAGDPESPQSSKVLFLGSLWLCVDCGICVSCTMHWWICTCDQWEYHNTSHRHCQWNWDWCGWWFINVLWSLWHAHMLTYAEESLLTLSD